MFDVLGVIVFFLMVWCIVMLIISAFSRRVNTKLWSIVLVGSFVLMLSFYGIDKAVDAKKAPIEIDYSTVPTPTPEPVSTPTPTPMPTPEITPAPDESESGMTDNEDEPQIQREQEEEISEPPVEEPPAEPTESENQNQETEQLNGTAVAPEVTVTPVEIQYEGPFRTE